MAVHREVQYWSSLTQWTILNFPPLILISVFAGCSCFSTSSSASLRPTVKENITVGLLFPGAPLFASLYLIRRAGMSVSRDNFVGIDDQEFTFIDVYDIKTEMIFLPRINSPIDIPPMLCDTIFPKHINVIFMTNLGHVRTSSIFNRYFFEMVSNLGIPVFSLDSNTVGFDQKASKNVIMQMTPSLVHQASVMISIVQRFSWKRFSIVSSLAVGHRDFIQAIKNKINKKEGDVSLTLLTTIKVDPLRDNVTMSDQLRELRRTESRIIILYATPEEAQLIFKIAGDLGLTGKLYAWIVAQVMTGGLMDQSSQLQFPVGTLGIFFKTNFFHLLTLIDKAAMVLAHGLELFLNDVENNSTSLVPRLSCNSSGYIRWSEGENFIKYLRNVSFHPGEGEPIIEFNDDGTLKFTNLTIMNMKEDRKWEPCGFWTPDGLTINVTVWPGKTRNPPSEYPVNPHLKIVFKEEPPFIFLSQPDAKSKKCINRQVICNITGQADDRNSSNSTHTQIRCCSGLLIDMLKDFSQYLHFTYDLIRVEDGVWGEKVDGQWIGLVAPLVESQADLVLTSFSINSLRAKAVDFTIPFMDTGIAIVVAKKTGIISTKAFLEPFDTMSWIMILLVSIHVATFAIFTFERLSPSGYYRVRWLLEDKTYRFSLLRTYWMVWADLFSAAVSVNCPRSTSARFMAGAWAMFAIVFLAIYTANLTTFMITREKYHNFTGIKDERLLNPYTLKSPMRFGTVPHGNTDFIIRNNHPEMHLHMQQFSRVNVTEGIKAVKKGELDAFIYDAMTLNYLVDQDDDCKLLTVGSWYAKTGYGIAFPRKSIHLPTFNNLLILYKEYGLLDRLQRFWLSGKCHRDRQRPKSSDPITLAQFTSVFIMLGLGILFAVFVFLIENICFKYFRKNFTADQNAK